MRKVILVLSLGVLVTGIFSIGLLMERHQVFCSWAKSGYDSGAITKAIAQGICSDHGFETLFGAEGSVKADAAKRERCRKAMAFYKKGRFANEWVVELICFDLSDDSNVQCADIQFAYSQGLISAAEKKDHCN